MKIIRIVFYSIFFLIASLYFKNFIWQAQAQFEFSADINQNGLVDIFDYSLVVSQFNQTIPILTPEASPSPTIETAPLQLPPDMPVFDDNLPAIPG